MVQQPSRTCGWFIPLSSKQTGPGGEVPSCSAMVKQDDLVYRSSGIGGTPLQQESVAGVADSDRFWWSGQRQLIIWAAVAENLSAVPTMVLEKDQRWVLCSLIKRYWMFPMIRGPTFLLEMENSFSHSLHWLASLSFNQTWPLWNNRSTLSTCLNLLNQHHRHRHYATWRALLASLISSIFIFDLVRKITCQVNESEILFLSD